MSELHDLHGQLLGMLDALERLTAQPVPDEAALAGLRYQLTRTSGARRKLVDALCLELRMGLPADETRR